MLWGPLIWKCGRTKAMELPPAPEGPPAGPPPPPARGLFQGPQHLQTPWGFLSPHREGHSDLGEMTMGSLPFTLSKLISPSPKANLVVLF